MAATTYYSVQRTDNQSMDYYLIDEIRRMTVLTENLQRENAELKRNVENIEGWEDMVRSLEEDLSSSLAETARLKKMHRDSESTLEKFQQEQAAIISKLTERENQLVTALKTEIAKSKEITENLSKDDNAVCRNFGFAPQNPVTLNTYRLKRSTVENDIRKIAKENSLLKEEVQRLGRHLEVMQEEIALRELEVAEEELKQKCEVLELQETINTLMDDLDNVNLEYTELKSSFDNTMEKDVDFTEIDLLSDDIENAEDGDLGLSKINWNKNIYYTSLDDDIYMEDVDYFDATYYLGGKYSDNVVSKTFEKYQESLNEPRVEEHVVDIHDTTSSVVEDIDIEENTSDCLDDDSAVVIDIGVPSSIVEIDVDDNAEIECRDGRSAEKSNWKKNMLYTGQTDITNGLTVQPKNRQETISFSMVLKFMAMLFHHNKFIRLSPRPNTNAIIHFNLFNPRLLLKDPRQICIGSVLKDPTQMCIGSDLTRLPNQPSQVLDKGDQSRTLVHEPDRINRLTCESNNLGPVEEKSQNYVTNSIPSGSNDCGLADMSDISHRSNSQNRLLLTTENENRTVDRTDNFSPEFLENSLRIVTNELLKLLKREQNLYPEHNLGISTTRLQPNMICVL